MTDEEHRRLRDEKDRIAAEIRDYPTPIAGCDAQFNDLLARRGEIDRHLAAIDAQPRQAASGR